LTSSGHDDTYGIIFPILPHHLQRFFVGRKKVFAKYFGNERIPVRLRVGSRLFFYESGGNKQVVGEARIVGIESGTHAEVLTRYGDDLFLTPVEFEAYARDRRAKRMLVLVLEDVKKYAVPLRLNKGLTMAGQYMTREILGELRRNG